MAVLPPPGIDMLLAKLKRIHPSHHAKKNMIINQIVAILDNWISKHYSPQRKDRLVILAETLDKISKQDYYVYSELLKRTRHPRIYQQAINYLHWARLHKRLGGRLPFRV